MDDPEALKEIFRKGMDDFKEVNTPPSAPPSLPPSTVHPLAQPSLPLRPSSLILQISDTIIDLVNDEGKREEIMTELLKNLDPEEQKVGKRGREEGREGGREGGRAGGRRGKDALLMWTLSSFSTH